MFGSREGHVGSSVADGQEGTLELWWKPPTVVWERQRGQGRRGKGAGSPVRGHAGGPAKSMKVTGAGHNSVGTSLWSRILPLPTLWGESPEGDGVWRGGGGGTCYYFTTGRC